MTYYVQSDFGQRPLIGGGHGHAVMAPCGVALGREITADKYFRQLTNLGELGDTTHYSEGYRTDHIPGWRHGNLWYVRAMDFGGPAAVQEKFFKFCVAMYQAMDPRLWCYGYPKGTIKNLIVDWPPGTGLHYSGGDSGHVHLSFTQRDGNNPGPNGWVKELDSTATWGLTHWRLTGELSVLGRKRAPASPARPVITAAPGRPASAPAPLIQKGTQMLSIHSFGKAIYATDGIHARRLKTMSEVRRMQAYLKNRGGSPVIIAHDPKKATIAMYGKVI